jgi:hypoxanthine phosphoribosyltransferase
MQVIDKTEDQLLELFSADLIQARIVEIAKNINNDFNGEELYVLGVLKGSVMFVTDLIKHFNMPVQLEFIRLSSYGNDQQSSGKVNAVDLTLPSLEGKNVLIVEDIVDTGLTANFLIDYLNLQHNAKQVKFATLLDKTCARRHNVPIDYTCFPVDDKFVVGYGLDYMGYFRNLPYIGYFPQ